MQSNKSNTNRITNRITNPNFLNKTTPDNNFTKSNVVNNTASLNSQSTKTILQKVKSARLTSVINISNMNLEILPPEIFDESLKFDDVDWWQMVDIKKLDASGNKLNSENMQVDFSTLPTLNYLKFSQNLFNSIPDSIYQLKNLKFLDFSNNKISQIKADIGYINSIVDLNLSNNNLYEIPNEFSNLKELEILNLSNNKLCEISGNFTKIKRLDISENILTKFQIKANLLEELILFKNKISEIDLTNLNNLVYFDMHNNLLTEFSRIPNSNKLDTIILGYNKLTKISNLKNTPKITVLDVNNNKLENLSEEILFLKELKTLNLMNNSINDLPPQLCFLKNLVRINLDGNPLKKINSKVRSSNAENIKAYMRTRLTEEDLKKGNEELLRDELIDDNTFYKTNNNFSITSYIQNNCLKMNNLFLEEIPIEQLRKYNMKILNSLDFSNNKITSLDSLEEILMNNNLSELREIKFSQNKIKIFPDFGIILKNLKIIDLRGNELFSFFDIDDNNYRDNLYNNYNIPFNKIYPYLEYLDLSINKLRKIPSIVKYFRNLSTLLLANNLITDISDLILDKEKKSNEENSFLNNQVLDTLDLGNNKIEGIHEKIYRTCPNLKNLNLENNEIKIIPTDLCLLQNLNRLNLNGNPIKMIRSNILLAGTKAILDYLKKMHKFDQEDVRHDQAISKSTNQIKNIKLEKTNFNNEQSEKMLVDDETMSEIEKVNTEILEIESELNGNLPVYKKTELKKKLNALIRYRANLMK